MRKSFIALLAVLAMISGSANQSLAAPLYRAQPNQPVILEPTNGQKVGFEFIIKLDAPSALEPYIGLGIDIQPVGSSTPRAWPRPLDRDTPTIAQSWLDINNRSFASAIAESESQIKVLISIPGTYNITVSRQYRYVSSGNDFSVESEVRVEALGSPFQDETKILSSSELKGIAFTYFGVRTCTKSAATSSSVVKPGDSLSCRLSAVTSPAISGRIKGQFLVAYGNEKPIKLAETTVSMNQQNFIDLKIKSTTQRYLTAYFVPEGLDLLKSNSFEVTVNQTVPVDPKTLMTVRVSATSVIKWGQSYKVSITTTPKVTGKCNLYFYNLGYIAIGTVNLKSGSGSRSVKMSFPGAGGNSVPFSITSTCSASGRSGKGLVILRGWN